MSVLQLELDIDKYILVHTQLKKKLHKATQRNIIKSDTAKSFLIASKVTKLFDSRLHTSPVAHCDKFLNRFYDNSIFKFKHQKKNLLFLISFRVAGHKFTCFQIWKRGMRMSVTGCGQYVRVRWHTNRDWPLGQPNLVQLCAGIKKINFLNTNPRIRWVSQVDAAPKTIPVQYQSMLR